MMQPSDAIAYKPVNTGDQNIDFWYWYFPRVKVLKEWVRRRRVYACRYCVSLLNREGSDTWLVPSQRFRSRCVTMIAGSKTFDLARLDLLGRVC
jgi:hypothetical protein